MTKKSMNAEKERKKIKTEESFINEKPSMNKEENVEKTENEIFLEIFDQKKSFPKKNARIFYNIDKDGFITDFFVENIQPFIGLNSNKSQKFSVGNDNCDWDKYHLVDIIFFFFVKEKIKDYKDIIKIFIQLSKIKEWREDASKYLIITIKKLTDQKIDFLSKYIISF